jgi:hypothetical protein
MLTRLHNGQVVIEQMRTDDNGKEIKVPGGLVHHWLAIGFIPGITRDQVIDLAQDYPRHPEVYAPDVQQAHVLAHIDQHFLVSYRFYRHAIVTTVYNTEFNPGEPDEKELSVGNDHGYMWRLNLYTRYLEKDNGVYVQIEFVALSRSAPGIVAWLANPYIRSIPTAYLTNYVRTTQRALSSQERFSGN